jgi:hypothetical protein
MMRFARVVCCWLLALAGARGAVGQSRDANQENPADALTAALTAACRHDQTAFASRLTAYNAGVFQNLSEDNRRTLLARLILLEGAGSALLSTGSDGRAIVRCESGGLLTEMHLGAAEIRENLAFVPVEAISAGGPRSVRFGMVREAGEWRLLSVGLLLLDLPVMAKEWAIGDIREQEARAVGSLRRIAEALQTYQRAFDTLPEGLEQLGPAPPGGLSPDRAALIDEALAAGEKDGYSFRYVIVPTGGATSEPERSKTAGFALAATPVNYGASRLRSFFLDSTGTLRGADKGGAVATIEDPRIDDPRP